MKRRLFAGFGTANIINIIAVLELLPKDGYENFYAFLGEGRFFETVKEFIKSSFAFENIYNLSSNEAVFKITKERLEGVIDIKSFDEIYLQFNGSDYREFTSKYPRADIFLIEDGLKSYLKQSSLFLTHKSPKALYSYNYLGNFLPHECRYNGLKNIQIPKSAIRNAYNFYNKDLAPVYDENTVILCPQDLFASDIMTYEDELRMYSDCVAFSLEQGYNVLIKEHPRTKCPFSPRLRGMYKTEKVKKFSPNTLPIEIYLSKFKPKALVSPFSTSLFLASEVLDCPVYYLDYHKYKPSNLSIKNFDFALILTQSKYAPAENIDKPYICQVSDEINGLLLRLKEIQTYKIFISRAIFYELKQKYGQLNISDENLRQYKINKSFAEIMRNGFYFDLIFYNFQAYKEKIEQYVRVLASAKTPIEFLRYSKYGLKTIFKLLS